MILMSDIKHEGAELNSQQSMGLLKTNFEKASLSLISLLFSQQPSTLLFWNSICSVGVQLFNIENCSEHQLNRLGNVFVISQENYHFEKIGQMS